MTIVDEQIYARCLDHRRQVSSLDFVVPDSIPIPYFGDVEQYIKSERRILTAALNPSDAEFPTIAPRFDVARGLKSSDFLEHELKQYFYNRPYSSWFLSFEPVLNGMGASYGGKMSKVSYQHTALHLDMCSPIATSPTWSKMTPEQRSLLTPVGREIFERLIDDLKPDMVIASIGWAHIQDWHESFRTGRSWKPTLSYSTIKDGSPARVPLLVQTNRMISQRGHAYIFANCSASTKPFGNFHNQRKTEVGSALSGLLG